MSLCSVSAYLHHNVGTKIGAFEFRDESWVRKGGKDESLDFQLFIQEIKGLKEPFLMSVIEIIELCYSSMIGFYEDMLVVKESTEIKKSDGVPLWRLIGLTVVAWKMYNRVADERKAAKKVTKEGEFIVSICEQMRIGAFGTAAMQVLTYGQTIRPDSGRTEIEEGRIKGRLETSKETDTGLAMYQAGYNSEDQGYGSENGIELKDLENPEDEKNIPGSPELKYGSENGIKLYDLENLEKKKAENEEGRIKGRLDTSNETNIGLAMYQTGYNSEDQGYGSENGIELKDLEKEDPENPENEKNIPGSPESSKYGSDNGIELYNLENPENEKKIEDRGKDRGKDAIEKDSLTEDETESMYGSENGTELCNSENPEKERNGPGIPEFVKVLDG